MSISKAPRRRDTIHSSICRRIPQEQGHKPQAKEPKILGKELSADVCGVVLTFLIPRASLLVSRDFTKKSILAQMKHVTNANNLCLKMRLVNTSYKAKLYAMPLYLLGIQVGHC